MEEARFCIRCGGPLEVRVQEDRPRPACPACGWVFYADPKLVVGAVVPQDGRVLLVRRANEPGLGLWALPGGFVDRGEPPADALRREVEEETGLRVEVGRLVGVYAEPGHPVVLLVYEARPRGGTLQPGSDALEVGFFSPSTLPPLAFPRDRRVLEEWSRLPPP